MTVPNQSRLLADTLWLLTARSRGGNHWVSNVHSRIETVAIGGGHYPSSLLQASAAGESYVASPRSTWLRYAREEAIRHWPAAGLLKHVCSLLFAPLSLLLHGAGLDRAVIIANQLISTNLYPRWQGSDLSAMSEQLCNTHPDRPLMLRNICPQVDPQLFAHLNEQGWILIPTRMVYLCDPAHEHVSKHNHVKKDARLLADGQVSVVSHEQLQVQDLLPLRDLFRQLFITKHSPLNPDFSLEFFQLCLETGFLELHGLRWQGRWVGVLGLYAHADSGWLTTPLIGYDTSLPQELGLYRRLMALLLDQAKQRCLRLHYSSGAAQFKRARGGVPALEYSAVYEQHLPQGQKRYLQLFAKTLQRCAPAILRRADQL